MDWCKHDHPDWIDSTDEGKVCQLLELAEALEVSRIESLSAECHDALYSAATILGGKLQLAAPERARRFEEETAAQTAKAAKQQETIDSLHGGQANVVGEQLGITNEEFV